MFADREGAVYVNYCHQCGRALSSAQVERCERCAWLRCECGACGCGYEASPSRPLLATVPPGPGGATRHVEAVPLAGRPPRSLPWLAAVVGVALIAAGLLAATRWSPQLASDRPEPARGVAVDQGERPAAVAPPTSVSAGAPSAESAPAAAVSPAATAEVPAAEPPATAVPGGATPVLPAVLYVANTDGLGAFIRTQPRDTLDTRIFAWKDGTPLVPLEIRSVAEPNGPAVWVRVRDPRGQDGWIRQAYLSPRP